MMSKVMEGVRLLEVADWGFVPSAAAVLGDWGADGAKNVMSPRPTFKRATVASVSEKCENDCDGKVQGPHPA